MGVPSFLFTRDPHITATPRGARQLLRANNSTFDRAMKLTPGLVQVLPRGWISFPRDTVLLMIGNTKELLDAFAAAWNRGGGITAIAGDNIQLECFYARIAVTFVQTDTVLAISAWGNRIYGTGADGWLPPPIGGGRQHGSLSLNPDENDPLNEAQTDRLSRIISSCQTKSWIRNH
jgi:hypothetical protein